MPDPEGDVWRSTGPDTYYYTDSETESGSRRDLEAEEDISDVEDGFGGFH